MNFNFASTSFPQNLFSPTLRSSENVNKFYKIITIYGFIFYYYVRKNEILKVLKQQRVKYLLFF